MSWIWYLTISLVLQFCPIYSAINVGGNLGGRYGLGPIGFCWGKVQLYLLNMFDWMLIVKSDSRCYKHKCRLLLGWLNTNYEYSRWQVISYLGHKLDRRQVQMWARRAKSLNLSVSALMATSLACSLFSGSPWNVVEVDEHWAGGWGGWGGWGGCGRGGWGEHWGGGETGGEVCWEK